MLLRNFFVLLATLYSTYATTSLPVRCPFNQAPGKNGSCASVAGASCDAQHPCIDGATCNTVYNLCFCNSDKAEQQDTGLCVVPAGGNCTCDSDCDRTLACERGVCQCPFGTTYYPNFLTEVLDPITTASAYKYVNMCLITASQRCEPNGYAYTPSQCTYSLCDPDSERCICEDDSTWNPVTETCDCIRASYHTTTSTDCYSYAHSNMYASPEYGNPLFFCNDQTFQNDVTHSCDCLGASYFPMNYYGSDCTPYEGAIKMTVNGTSVWQCPPGTTANISRLCQCDATITLDGETSPSCICVGASYPIGASYCQMYTNAIGGFENGSWVWSCPGGSVADETSTTCDCLDASYFANADDVTCTPFYGAISVTVNETAIWTCPEGVITSDTDLSCGCFGASYPEDGKDYCTPYDYAQQGWIGNFYGWVCPDGFVANDTSHSCGCTGVTYLVTVDYGFGPYTDCDVYTNAVGVYSSGVTTWSCPDGSVADSASYACVCIGDTYFATPDDTFCTNSSSND